MPMEAGLTVDGKTVARIIAKNLENLKYIDHDAVIACLLEKQVIDHTDHVDISEKSQKEKVLFLQKILPLKGDSAFQKFLECLEASDHKKLAETMRQAPRCRLTFLPDETWVNGVYVRRAFYHSSKATLPHPP
ncbi:unnamed protein product [Darwinula stevensoni]|uniref:CARD domain-containing protein n=1 Tax=Darwinula stevensoni TaxID=69355 RepID=A0A7R9FN79_9CRUS|nr:unnamed protein product [Darwinula stevensoni]CAG0896204.1 unnamed protein product [Darwinula stevensoni]